MSTVKTLDRRPFHLLAVLGSIGLLLATGSCSLHQRSQRLAIDLLTEGWSVYADESDFELARIATFSALKQVEALLVSAPRDTRLLQASAQGFGFAALAFLEDDLELMQERRDSDAALETARARAMNFYRRGRTYARRLLAISRPDLASALEARDMATLRPLLEHVTNDQLPGLFFWTFSEAGLLQLEPLGAGSLARLQVLQTMVARLLTLDPTYFSSAMRLIAGGLDCRLPMTMGGHPQRGRDQFRRAYEETGGSFLLAQVTDARYCTTATRDREAFDALLATVENAPPDILPGQGLLTTVAKRRAERLQRLANQTFPEGSPP